MTVVANANTMQRISFRPTVRTFHRYRPDEMRGVLPTILYKVLPITYAQRFVDKGEMMWSTLTWFQNVEDASRRDGSEGMHRYFPIKGLEITRLECGGRPDRTSFVRPEDGMVSKAAQSDHIFIYSMTLDPALTIGDVNTTACVEVFDTSTFLRNVIAAIGRHRSARSETLIYDEVKYWAPERPPEALWALPHQLTMHKHQDFSWQREYRLAVGTRANVFDFENIEGFIVHKDYRWPILTLSAQAHRMRLQLGPLAECCRLMPPKSD